MHLQTIPKNFSDEYQPIEKYLNSGNSIPKKNVEIHICSKNFSIFNEKKNSSSRQEPKLTNSMHLNWKNKGRFK